MNERLRITFYLASAIEHANFDEAHDWKVKVKQELGKPGVGIYDPIEQEAVKTGKSAPDTIEYVNGLKRGGHWERFYEQMHKVWWGDVSKIPEKLLLLSSFKQRAAIDGNRLRDFAYWGDDEAVARSTFIIALLEKNVRTVGTIREIHDAYLLNVPVFLVIPDQTKTEANSTLLEMIRGSGGEVFYSVNECIKFIRDKYRIGD
jgi:hypothetical protein